MNVLKRWWKELAIVLMVGGAYFLCRHYGLTQYLNFEYVREHRRALYAYVHAHYAPSVFIFCIVYMTAALFLPGAVVLSLIAGYLFGVIPGVIYVSLSATAGAAASLLLSRHLIGSRIQKRYGHRLGILNRLVERHGLWYLILLRVIPVFPFFVINYLTGLTRMRVSTFVLSTFFGVLPGSVILAYAGKRLGAINSLEDVWTPESLLAIGLVALLALLAPVVQYYLRHSGNRDG